jgi:K(+)-stimulated pyrophosphate-energized sodium pump
VQLLVWIFVMRVLMIVASGASYLLNDVLARARYGTATRMNFEAPLTSLVWITSAVSVLLTYVASYALVRDLGDGSLWWKLSTVITCGTLAGAIIPELVKVFTSTESRHVREVVTSAREGGASLDILSGFVAGNFSAYWLGVAVVVLMGTAYLVSTTGLGGLMAAPAVFAFGLVAFGFLGMGPVTIAVDSYGPVTDNAQSVFELSVIEQIPGIKPAIKRAYGFEVNFETAKHLLEENDGTGNTFKATAKPVLIGTAVVGATTMIFSIIVLLTHGLRENLDKLSLLHPPFLLGLITGGAMIYWFTGAATQAVTTGAYRAVEFIKANIKLEGVTRASVTDSKRVVEICTQYAQKGMFNIFLTVFFATLAFAFLEPYFFIGYLISIALFGLFQAVFMANAGGAWDNAKKIVEVDLKEKGTPLHAATVVGDTVGDPFKDTSSVAMNPIIKFTTLFGLLAVELAVTLSAERGTGLSLALAALFFAVSVTFVWRSFYAMRIGGGAPAAAGTRRVGAVEFLLGVVTGAHSLDGLIRWGGYAVLVGIVFTETGLLVGFFLPGDSLLVTAGLVASAGGLSIWWINGLLIVAAVVGDNVGYAIGARLGPRLFTREQSLLFNPRHVERTRRFYARHGARTIVIARFVPIIRTFAPVVAGVGEMPYRRFVLYNVAGGVGWVTTMTWAGYLLGRAIPNIAEYLQLVVIFVIVLSVIPIAVEILKERRRRAG